VHHDEERSSVIEQNLIKVAGTRDVREGQLLGVSIKGEEILLVRLGEKFYATANMCTHAEGWLDMGELHPCTAEIECPFHGGRFDLLTGKPTAEPCVEPIRSYRVVIEGEDVLIDLDA
jgi:nitrite reductase/ring-hydroxylating ferredoxin subunit